MVATTKAELPQSLYGQLFLLAYDRRRARVDGDDRWRFGLALRTAMLADLYLAGHVEDVGGRPALVAGTRPDDRVLRAILNDVASDEQRSWTRAVSRHQRRIPGLVRSHLEASGWLSVQRHRALGIVPATRIRLNDHDLVGALADQVIVALRNAIAARPADDRLVAVGLIGALGELPTVFDVEEASRHHRELDELVYQGIPPLNGMRQVIDAVHSAMSANASGPWSL
jgi:hypothetical protein